MRTKMRPLDGMVIFGLVIFVAYLSWGRGQTVDSKAAIAGRMATFSKELDLAPFRRLAVQADGRLRSFESHASAYVRRITGPSDLHGSGFGFTYLDMLLRPEAYSALDCVYVKNSLILAQVLERMAPDALSAERKATILKSKRIAPEILSQPTSRALMAELGRDLIKTSKFVDLLQGALYLIRPEQLGTSLRLVPPDTENREAAWVSPWMIATYGDLSAIEETELHVEVRAARETWLKIAKAERVNLQDAWDSLASSWKRLDADGVNKAAAEFAKVVDRVAPASYPAPSRLEWESWYARQGSMTWIWLIYLLSVIPLLVSVIQTWAGARQLGMGLFMLAFALHTGSLGLRWYVSGRWPNANMFEAVTTAAWFGGVLAIVLETALRNSPLRSLFALGSSVVSMVSLMAAYYLPATLDGSINNVTPALHDVWLYVHTNVIIWSYAVIGLAAVTALLYLRDRWCRLWDNGGIARWRLLASPLAFLMIHVGGWEILLTIVNPEQYVMASTIGQFAIYFAFAASCGLLLFEALEAWRRGQLALATPAGSEGEAGRVVRPRHGETHASAFVLPERPSAAAVLDSATMVSLQLAFVMLWAGIVMGAIWADHSWGRPWGWDPKEVFALNTFIIFLILVHVRLKVRDKGLWTAFLAIFGFETMLFNWIVINFVISGLHSYA